MNPGLNYENAPNIIGGGYGSGLGGGGFGGFGLFGLLGLRGIGGFGDEGRRGDDNCAREAALLQAISNAKDTTVAEGRSLGAAICATNDNIKDGNYAAAIQAERNTAQLSAQAQAFQIATDKSIDALAAAGVAQTAAILARINDAEVQGLRDQLNEQRHYGRTRDLEINISNQNSATANATQAQIQAQAQWQVQRDHENQRRFDSLFNSFNQLNRNTQDIVNLGTMTASGTQANAQNNIQ